MIEILGERISDLLEISGVTTAYQDIGGRNYFVIQYKEIAHLFRMEGDRYVTVQMIFGDGQDLVMDHGFSDLGIPTFESLAMYSTMCAMLNLVQLAIHESPRADGQFSLDQLDEGAQAEFRELRDGLVLWSSSSFWEGYDQSAKVYFQQCALLFSDLYSQMMADD
jgi:hypothetical protein